MTALVAGLLGAVGATPAPAQSSAALPPQASASCPALLPGQTGGYCGDGGPVNSARLATPRDVAALANGDVLVADAQNSVIRRISNGVISTVAGIGVPGDTPPSIPTPVASVALSDPRGVAGLADGSFVIADAGLRAVLLVTPTGLVRTLLDSRALVAPVDVAVLDADTVAVADAATGKVLAVDLRSGATRTLAGGLATPWQLAPDPTSGGLIVSEQRASPQVSGLRATAGDVIRLAPDGTRTVLAGPGATGVAGGLRFERPAGVFARPDGAVLVADRHVVYAVFPASGAVVVLAGVSPGDPPGITPAEAVDPGQAVAGITPSQAEGISVAGADLLIVDSSTSQILRAPDADAQPAQPAPPQAEVGFGEAGASAPVLASRSPSTRTPCVSNGLPSAFRALQFARGRIRVAFGLSRTTLEVALARGPQGRDSHLYFRYVGRPPPRGVILVPPKARGTWYVRVRARGGCNQTGPLTLR